MSPGQALLATQEDEDEGGKGEKQIHLCSLQIVGTAGGCLAFRKYESVSFARRYLYYNSFLQHMFHNGGGNFCPRSKSKVKVIAKCSRGLLFLQRKCNSGKKPSSYNEAFFV